MLRSSPIDRYRQVWPPFPEHRHLDAGAGIHAPSPQVLLSRAAESPFRSPLRRLCIPAYDTVISAFQAGCDWQETPSGMPMNKSCPPSLLDASPNRKVPAAARPGGLPGARVGTALRSPWAVGRVAAAACSAAPPKARDRPLRSPRPQRPGSGPAARRQQGRSKPAADVRQCAGAGSARPV